MEVMVIVDLVCMCFLHGRFPQGSKIVHRSTGKAVGAVHSQVRRHSCVCACACVCAKKGGGKTKLKCFTNFTAHADTQTHTRAGFSPFSFFFFFLFSFLAAAPSPGASAGRRTCAGNAADSKRGGCCWSRGCPADPRE